MTTTGTPANQSTLNPLYAALNPQADTNPGGYVRSRPRPACCTDGHANSCGGTCDYATAEQAVDEARRGI